MLRAPHCSFEWLITERESLLSCAESACAICWHLTWCSMNKRLTQPQRGAILRALRRGLDKNTAQMKKRQCCAWDAHSLRVTWASSAQQKHAFFASFFFARMRKKKDSDAWKHVKTDKKVNEIRFFFPKLGFFFQRSCVFVCWQLPLQVFEII